MTRARMGALLLFAGLLTVAAALVLSGTKREDRPGEQRSRLMILTSLPLLFGEGFGLQTTGSPALKELRARYDVVPISVASPPELSKGKLLLMAHPLAQPAEDLVALDEWVRGGGRVLLLADPVLEWPSTRPLGDPLRPPPAFADTGLLAHWGLRLDAPDQRGPEIRTLGGHEVITVSPGSLSGRCRISVDRLIARCKVGRGWATVVADADFLRGDELGSQASRNLEGLAAELALLERT